ncbi:hypothetical protein S40285_10341 [Stachybotrys chlorohalonatus IBT 40285]|uniref:Uncharacterized protein n=1 Tax=Stachybotrys chlorohalonatus (strain IBT 40285) TaxID=1283841 RepID=A0A084QF56_STAC4|nr:hypothetical protein S40285_10341 [Stachybotrys chlorohalonata IBT 40285]
MDMASSKAVSPNPPRHQMYVGAPVTPLRVTAHPAAARPTYLEPQQGVHWPRQLRSVTNETVLPRTMKWFAMVVPASPDTITVDPPCGMGSSKCGVCSDTLANNANEPIVLLPGNAPDIS